MKLKTVNQFVSEIKVHDPDTAVNRTMVLTLIANGEITVRMHGTRAVVDYDTVVGEINDMLGITSDTPAHIRTLKNAYIHLHTNNPEIGLSEVRIRDLVRDGIIPTLDIGNRKLVALERFFAPYDTEIIKNDTKPGLKQRSDASLEYNLGKLEHLKRK